MSLVFLDGFEHYTIDQILDKYDYWAGSTSYVGINSSYGRYDGSCLFIKHRSGYVTKVLPTNYTTLYIGFAAYHYNTKIPYAGDTEPYFSFLDENGLGQVFISLTSDFGVVAYRGYPYNSTLLGTSSNNGLMENRNWYYIECKVTISDTVGEVVVRINEEIVLNLTNQDTKYGTANIRQVKLECPYVDTSFETLFIDDFYIDDAQFHGDCSIKSFQPDADGNSTDFTRSTGSNDYECVDESPSNEDTDYVYSDTLNHKSIFGITTGALGTVKGIQVNNHVKVSETQTRKIKPIIRSGGTDYQGVESDALPESYTFEHDIWETDPQDATVWTQTKLEAAEFGLEITATS